MSVPGSAHQRRPPCCLPSRVLRRLPDLSVSWPPGVFQCFPNLRTFGLLGSCRAAALKKHAEERKVFDEGNNPGRASLSWGITPNFVIWGDTFGPKPETLGSNQGEEGFVAFLGFGPLTNSPTAFLGLSGLPRRLYCPQKHAVVSAQGFWRRAALLARLKAGAHPYKPLSNVYPGPRRQESKMWSFSTARSV